MALRKENIEYSQTPPTTKRHAIPETLQKVLRVRERLMQKSKGELFEDSAELLRKQREERSRYLEQIT